MSVALAVVFVHVLGVVVWIGGTLYQAHVLLPVARRGATALFADAAIRGRPVTWTAVALAAARRGAAALFADAAVRGRPATWTAVALVVLTGFYNVTQLGALDRVMASGAGVMLAAKFTLVILAVALAAQRDFAQVPLLRAALAAGGDPSPPLRAIARLDRLVIVLAVVVIWLGLAVSRS